jgi:hypothetical protein
VHYPDYCFCGVMEYYVVPFCKSVVFVFRDIIYIINILYS